MFEDDGEVRKNTMQDVVYGSYRLELLLEQVRSASQSLHDGFDESVLSAFASTTG
jgi:hypothetical protein